MDPSHGWYKTIDRSLMNQCLFVVDDFYLVSFTNDSNLRGWGFFFTLWKFVLLDDGIHRCIILFEWMRFFFVTFQIPFFHIIGLSFGRFKSSSVHVNQQAI